MAERNITMKDAEAIGDAVARSLAGQDPAQRLEAAKRGMSDAIRAERQSLRDRREARALGRLNRPAQASPEDR